MKNKAQRLTFDDIKIGREVSFKRFISERDVKEFARLTGDFNPLHLDEKFAKATQFKKPIIHGMFAASLFSTLIGMYCPGRHALILSQEIHYMKPICANSTVKVVGEVTAKIDAVKVVIIKITILDKNGKTVVEGTSKVKVMR